MELLDVGMTENFLWSPGASGFGAGTADLGQEQRICSLGCQDGVGDVSCGFLWAWLQGLGCSKETGRGWDGPGHEAKGLWGSDPIQVRFCVIPKILTTSFTDQQPLQSLNLRSGLTVP